MTTQLARQNEGESMGLMQMGQMFAKSGFFNDSRDAAQAIVKIQAGKELGFPPVVSMTGIYIVKGKVSLSANLIAAAIKRSGKYTYHVNRLDEEACELEFFEGAASIGKSGFTIADAKRQGTQNTDKFPRNMLFARALSNGAKWFCPDVFGGPVYTPDELGATVDDDGNVTSVHSAPAAQVRQIENQEPAADAAIQEPQPATEPAHPNDVQELSSLVADLKIDEKLQAAWLKKAKVTRFEELPADIVKALIVWCQKQIPVTA